MPTPAAETLTPIAPRRARPRAGRVPWGWLEWTIIAQTALPAMVFLPQLGAIRLLSRIGALAVTLLAWGAVASSGRRAAGRPFPALPVVQGLCIWLLLEVLHPEGNAPLSVLGGLALNLATLSPVFWAGRALRSSGQLRRVVMVLLFCNLAGTLMGIAQFFRPDRFMPNIDFSAYAAGAEDQMAITADDGRKVHRPPGLTDVLGAACNNGAITCMIAVSLAVRPGPWWKRAIYFSMAILGVAVIYFSQVRSVLIMALVCMVGMTVMFALRGEVGRALQMVAAGVLAVLLAMAWVIRVGGGSALQRFASLLDDKPLDLYERNRGGFLRNTLETMAPNYPLGAGLGRWGQVFFRLGDHGRPSIWVEIQPTAWLVDGGIPLLVGYPLAMCVGMYAMVRVARTCPDREVGAWAVPIAALSLSVFAICLSGVPFATATGAQFWMLLSAMWAADQLARRERRGAGARA